ncbi:MAG TPA: TonB-dependent receptor [Chitinophagaceae bacterium]|nr:TonB-dependent receptor [Chitinophagaceae bacterium]
MITKIIKLTIVITIVFVNYVSAQSISGTVVDNTNKQPLSGVSIKVVGTSNGTTTDANGAFTVKADAQSKLDISQVGYTPQRVSVNGQQEITIELLVQQTVLESVTVAVGSRSAQRTLTDTPLPVDIFSSNDLKSTGQISFDKALEYRVPSFNTVNTPVNDATTLIDPYEIRNLGPSRTLVLINGKRKNLSSLLYVQFSPGRGETGADLSAIPADAIKRVEILRDGASAQYGSDAIAGVMNVILKDKVEYNSLTLNGGITSEGDGGTYGLSYNGGSTFASKGFINYTVDFSQQDNAVRSGKIDLLTEIATFGDPSKPQTDPANKPIVDFLKIYPTGNNTNGTGEITAAKFEYNFGVPIGEIGQFYSNAALVSKKVISNANYRVPYWRQDLGLLHVSDPNGTDYTGTGDPIYKGYIGYRPSFEGDLIDYNATFGFKKEKNGWNQDVSFTLGGNQQLYAVNNTINRSLGTASPITFKPGGFRFTNIIGNYDISKAITDNFGIAFGSEIRSESFKIISGDTASYSGEGANSFPGIRAENASTNSRFNLGAYFDASWDITKDFLINGTIRGEKYSDFGTAFVWKGSTRYKIANDKVVIRGSASTGFRAPTLHQIYDQSTQASFVGGTIQLSGLFNNRSKQAFALGIPLLKPEKSNNYTIGLGFNPVKNLSITLDYYSILIKDRIVYSSPISSSDSASTLYKILKSAGVVQIQFFINGIKTETDGLDFVANYRNIHLGNGKLGVNLAGNYTLVNKIVGNPNNPKAISDAGANILSIQIRSLLTESRPKFKGVLGLDYFINKFNINLNNTLFGPTKFQDLDNGGSIMNNIKQVFKTAVVTDLNIGYAFTNKVSAAITVNNLLDVLPKWGLELTGSSADANYANAVSTLNDPAAKSLLEGFLEFSGRYRILGYNGSQFSQLGTIFQASINFKF